jgi:FdrA protein
VWLVHQEHVGAITANQSLDLLKRDPDTKVIVLVSKPPSPDVATQLISAAQATGNPVVVYFIGYPPPARKIGNIHFAISLQETAEIAVRIENESVGKVEKETTASSYLRGLFSGGTLAYETLVGLQASLSPIYSNAPITENQTLKDPLKSESHTIIDLGDEFFMVGRLHPMIDNDLRIRRMKQEAEDPEVGMILLDVVLGEGSHMDPAGELVPAIKEIKGNRSDIEFVAMVIGTDNDPQNVQTQVDQLKDAGVIVFRTATETVEYISLRFGKEYQSEGIPVDLEQLKQPLAAINVGLESFYESLTSQGAQAVHVEWRPPAGGNEKMAALLAKMKK